MSDVASEIRAFLSSVTNGRSFGDTEDFFDLGYVDSMLALELVTYVERRFDLTVEVEDLDLDNFRTISRIEQFVLRKRRIAAVPGGPDGNHSTGQRS